MKNIIIIFFIVILLALAYIIINMEIPLLNTTITKDNIYSLSVKVDNSNLSDEVKTKIIMNLIIQNESCYGKKIKDLI